MQSRTSRRRLLLSTTMLMGALTGYGGRAYAQVVCLTTGASSFLCDNASDDTQTITAYNATVTTTDDFAIDTTVMGGSAGDGLVITGAGALSYEDNNASPIKAQDTALRVESIGDDAGAMTNGSISIITDGDLIGGVGDMTGSGFGIFANNLGSGGISIETAGAVTGLTADGIYAVNSILSASGITITTGPGEVFGGDDGIFARNLGEGGVLIEANGNVTGAGDAAVNSVDGIYAYNSVDSYAGITVTTGAGTNVSGYGFGLRARNYGDGGIEVTANGNVTGGGVDAVGPYGYDGINAFNSSGSLNGITITTGVYSEVNGQDDGMVALNYGNGGIMITANGSVIGEGATTTAPNQSAGIQAYNSSGSDFGITIITGANAVSGGAYGIYAENFGGGLIAITANGDVTGWTGDGINASNSGLGAITITANGAVTGGDDGIDVFNSSNSGYGISIITGAGPVQGGDTGIDATNLGAGALIIIANGAVTGTNYDGINAFNSSAGDYLTISTGPGAIIGGGDGIEAANSSGALTINVNGDVSGGDDINDDGIDADNSSLATSLTIITAAGTIVSGGGDGIRARNFGAGALTITAGGVVSGGDDGIYAFNSSLSAEGIEIFTGTLVSGAANGIAARNYGAGALSITVGGEATGNVSGIYAFNNNALDVAINNLSNGSISADSNLAIDVAGLGAANISNFGQITGFIDLTGQDDQFTNQPGGVFNAIGVSDFGGGADTFANSGTLLAGDPAMPASFINLEQFNNAGLISLADGQEGDSFAISGNFNGQSGSMLMVDTFLGGPGSMSDTLTIEGNVTGVTGIVVTDANPGPGQANAVIPIVFVEGDVSGDAFQLANGPIDKGFFQYDLFFRPTGSGVFELRSVGLPGPGPDIAPRAGPGAMLLPQLVTAQQDIWHQTSDTWFDRSADLRAARWHGYSMAALPGRMSAETHAAPQPLTAGVWARGSHIELDRDDRVTATTMGRDFRFDLDRELDVSDVQSGIDVPLKGVLNPHDVLILSVFGGGVWAGLDYDALSRRFDYRGGQLGAAATYLSGGWFVDALFNAQFLKLDPEAMAFPDKNLDAETYGFRIDSGYRIAGKYFLEPLLTLAYADSDLDGFTFAGNTVSFQAEDSLHGRVGLRAGVTWLLGGVRLEPFVIGSYWAELDDDDNRATLVSNGFRFDLRDDREDDWGEVSLGANLFKAGINAISAFSKVDIVFGDDTEGYAASGGVRWQW